MKKGIYRAVDLRRVNIEKVKKGLRGCVVEVAVDAAKEVQYGAIRPKGGDVIGIVKWKQPSEMGTFLEFLASLEASGVEVIVESTGTYADALRHQVQRAGCSVFRVSAKRVFDAAEVYDGVPSSHDAKAAWVIGRLHQEGLSVQWKDEGILTRRLRAVVKTKAMFDEAEQRAVCRLEAQLARYWPELTNLLKLNRVSLAALLEAHGGPEAVASDPDGAIRVLKKASRGGFKSERYKAVIESARTTIGCPMIEDERLALSALASELICQRQKGAEAEQRIHMLMTNDAGLEQAGEVFGKTTAAVFYTLVGDPQKFDSTGALLKGFGLNVKIRCSGKKRGELHITKRGPGLARWYMYLAALRCIKADPIVRAWYDKKVARDGGKLKMKAVVAVMRKLVKALWHVARGKAFDASLLFDTSVLDLAGRVNGGASVGRGSAGNSQMVFPTATSNAEVATRQ